MKILKINKFIVPLLLLIGIIACKKLENGALGDSPTGPMTQLKIKVINLKNNQPEPGVKFFISRKMSAKGEYQIVDTARTNANGEYQLDTPVPNDFKAFLDTTFYTGDTVSTLMTSLTPTTIELHTRPKFGMAPVEVSILDSASLQPIQNFDLSVSYRNVGKPNFIVAGKETTDANGKILISLPWPSIVKAKVFDPNFKPDSVMINHDTDNGATAVLKVSTLAAINLNLFDVADLQYITNEHVKFSIKPQGASSFNPISTQQTDENGNAQVLAKFPSVVKVEIQNLRFFKDTVFELPITNFTTINKKAGLYIKPAAYTEPVMTNLQVTSLVLNNGITLNGPQDVVTDKKGNIYITDAGNNRIVKVNANGNTSVLAGTGTTGMDNGAGDVATFAAPYGIKVANDGSLYVANNSSTGNFHSIRKIEIAPNGNATVSTVAGQGGSGSVDGIGAAAKFSRAAGLAIDKANKYLYTAEWGGNKVRRVEIATGEALTIAGSTSGVTAGNGTSAQFQIPWGIAIDEASENLYVASWNGSAISKVRLSDNEVTLVRKGATTNFNAPRGIYVSSQGQIVVANTGSHSVSKVANYNEIASSTFSLLAGKHGTSGNAIGTASDARFNGPIGLWYDRYTGNWYIVDTGNAQIKIIKSSDI